MNLDARYAVPDQAVVFDPESYHRFPYASLTHRIPPKPVATTPHRFHTPGYRIRMAARLGTYVPKVPNHVCSSPASAPPHIQKAIPPHGVQTKCNPTTPPLKHIIFYFIHYHNSTHPLTKSLTISYTRVADTQSVICSYLL
jgi:hypothetical protein